MLAERDFIEKDGDKYILSDLISELCFKKEYYSREQHLFLFSTSFIHIIHYICIVYLSI